MMAYQDIARQTLLEQGMLALIMGALRKTIEWKLESPAFSRKLSSVLFAAQSFQRHLERTLAVEEYDGYMDMVVQLCPHLARKIEVLRQEHDLFRKETRRIVYRLEHVSSTGHITLDSVCDELLVLLTNIEEHNRKEVDLLQEGFNQEEGGEG
jgi:hypothetical protein